MSNTKSPGSWIEYDIIVQKNVPVPMQDGVCLSADLYLPARKGKVAEGRFPVVMERTPYDKTNKYGEGRYFARRGYVAVMQDVRGRFASDGEWYPFAKEAPDGYDSVEWAAAQPWSSGRVGTMGDPTVGATRAPWPR